MEVVALHIHPGEDVEQRLQVAPSTAAEITENEMPFETLVKCAGSFMDMAAGRSWAIHRAVPMNFRDADHNLIWTILEGNYVLEVCNLILAFLGSPPTIWRSMRSSLTGEVNVHRRLHLRSTVIYSIVCKHLMEYFQHRQLWRPLPWSRSYGMQVHLALFCFSLVAPPPATITWRLRTPNTWATPFELRP